MAVLGGQHVSALLLSGFSRNFDKECSGQHGNVSQLSSITPIVISELAKLAVTDLSGPLECNSDDSQNHVPSLASHFKMVSMGSLPGQYVKYIQRKQETFHLERQVRWAFSN